MQEAVEQRNAADYGPEFRLSPDDTARLTNRIVGLVDTLEGRLRWASKQEEAAPLAE